MKIRRIVTIAIAALLLTGTVAAVTVYNGRSATLTPEEAQAIALNHAGVTAEQVHDLRTRLDYDDGVAEYEVDFRWDVWEYEYTIHGGNGKILDWDREYEKGQRPVTPDVPPQEEPMTPQIPPQQEPTLPDAPADSPATAITDAQARDIALAHAGLTEQQVYALEVEYDVDRGIAQWEVEFEAGGWEYAYEIHAETGQILHFETDWDD